MGKNIQVSVKDGAVIIAIKAQQFVYAETYNELNEVYSMNEVTSAASITVELNEVDMIDSSGLAMLLKMRDTLGQKTTIKINGANPQIKEVLAISGFDRLFQIS